MTSETATLKPIYILVVASLFLAITWGLIFKDMLEYQVNQWYANRSSQSFVNYQKPTILFTYVGLTLFITTCMGASFSVFGFPLWFAFLMAAIVVIPTGILVWLQLGSMLKLLVMGGSEAMDIDSYGAGEKFDVQASKSE